jgi:hypothetical protein
MRRLEMSPHEEAKESNATFLDFAFAAKHLNENISKHFIPRRTFRAPIPKS